MRTDAIDVLPGLCLDRDLRHPETGQILLSRGTILTEGFIRKIQKLGLDRALEGMGARDSRTGARAASQGDAAAEAVVGYELRLEGKVAISRLMDEARALLSGRGQARAAWEREAAWAQTETFAGHLVDRLGRLRVESYLEWRLYDAYVYAHPFNTAVLSVLMGQSMGFSGQQLRDLAMAAIVADIGTAWLPERLLNKIGQLEPAEREQVRAHVRYSMAILQHFRFGRGMIAQVAALHHERQDGTGYPKGLEERDLPQGAQIVGLADAYDAVLCDRPYRKRLEPGVAFCVLTASPAFSRGVVSAFSQRVAPYPRGTQVQLSTGAHGKVVLVTSAQPLRPVVQLPGERLDLASAPEVRVTRHIVPRRFNRLAHRLPVSIRNAEGQVWRATTVDLSLEGLGLEAEGVPPRGQSLYLTVLAGGRPVNAVGQVVWAGPKAGSKAFFAVSLVPCSTPDRDGLVQTLWNLA